MKYLSILLSVLLGAVISVPADTFELPLHPGWNQVSVPFDVDADALASLAQSQLLGKVITYGTDGFEAVDKLIAGQGYWMFAVRSSAARAAHTVTLTGKPQRNVTRHLQPGWHMIGGIGYEPYAPLAFPLATDPPGAIADLWQWDGHAYRQVSQLDPGRSVWAHVWEACEVRLSPNPGFSGITMAYSPGAGTLQLHWPQGIDDQTNPDELSYQVYAANGGAREALIAPGNLQATLANTYHLVLEDLTPDVEYQLTVVALDGDGNVSPFPQVLTARPLAEDLEVDATPRDLAAEGAPAPEVQDGGNTVILPAGIGAETGDVLIVPGVAGLRRVTTVDASRSDQTTVGTEAVSLSQVVRTGLMRGVASIPDLDALPQPSAARGATGTRYVDPDGFFRVPKPAPESDSPARGFFDSPKTAKIDGKYWVDFLGDEPGDGEGFEAGVRLDFTPILEHEARFADHPGRDDLDRVEQVTITAGGQLEVEADFFFRFDAAKEFRPDEPIKLNKTPLSVQLTYGVGPVPVHQEVGIDFYADFEVTANAALDISASLKASKTLTLGLQWQRDGDPAFQLIPQDEFERDFTFRVHSDGQLTAVGRIYPRIWTRFYKSATAGIAARPGLELNAAYQFVTVPPELTRFDLDFTLDAVVDADLSIFGFSIFAWNPDPTELYRAPLHSLPEIAFTQAPSPLYTAAPGQFVLSVTDGVNNAVLPEAITWDVVGTEPGWLSDLDLAADRQSGWLDASPAGDYRINVSVQGSGPLGAFGARRAHTDVQVIGIDTLTLTPVVVETATPGQYTITVAAAATYTDGTTGDVSTQATFTSSSPAVTSIDGNVLAVTAEPGTPVEIAGTLVDTVSSVTAVLPGLAWPFRMGEDWKVDWGSEAHAVLLPSFAGAAIDDAWALDLNRPGDADAGLPVHPVEAGAVVLIQQDYGFVVLRHDTPLALDDGSTLTTWYSGYMHMADTAAWQIGDAVTPTTILGHVAGKADGDLTSLPNHLHFAIYAGRHDGDHPLLISLPIQTQLAAWWNRHVASEIGTRPTPQLTLTPATVNLAVGASQTFTATIPDRVGGSYDVTAHTSFSVDREDLATMVGAGLTVAAGTSGDVIGVTGTYAGRTAAAQVEVVGPTAGDYRVVDLSAGADASSYPVSALDAIPDPVPDLYKTTHLLLRRIPAGTFTMGSPPDELGRIDGREQQHEVTLTADVYVGVFEVTQRQWELVMGNRPAYFSSGSWEMRPVEQVSYDDIRGSSAGANWPADNGVDASSFLGKLRARTSYAFDLPTEAQWEYACRAGTTSALNNGTELSQTGCGFDANLDEVAWYCGNDSSTTEHVGQKRANGWGLYDMHGNVWEWCLDWWVENHAATAVSDPVGAASGSHRVMRGGSWGNYARYCRSANRNWYRPNYRIRYLGLRLAVPVGQ